MEKKVSFLEKARKIKEKYDLGLLYVKTTKFSRILYFDESENENVRIKYMYFFGNNIYILQRKNEKGRWKKKSKMVDYSYSFLSYDLIDIIGILLRKEYFLSFSKRNPLF